jgi:hypothetical protein
MARTAQSSKPKGKEQPLPPVLPTLGAFQVLSVKDMVKAEWNYKKNSNWMMERLINNFRRNGQLETIVVRKIPKGKYEVVNGNHRLDAFQRLGIAEVHCFLLEKASLEEAKRIAVELNETRFDTDPVILSELIASIEKEFPEDLLQTLPITEEDLEGLRMMQKFDWANTDGHTGGRNEEPASEEKARSSITIQLKLNSAQYDRWMECCQKAQTEKGYLGDVEVFLHLIESFLKAKK